MTDQIIIGLGEVGRALREILQCDGFDKLSGGGGEKSYDMIHICFPYFEGFEDEVLRYKDLFGARIVIVHSSVPIGTCNKIGAVHSPIRGVHPNLVQGIRTFIKYFGGNPATLHAEEAARIFEDKGIITCVVYDARVTEAAKLWDTTQYGVMIMLEKEIHKFCEDNDLDFNIVYTNFNESYNLGYSFLGMDHVVRPRLKHMEGKIGGHCVLQNAALLDSPSAKRILAENE